MPADRVPVTPVPANPGDLPAQVRDFLVSRRERVTPEQAGLPAYGGANRRVKGCAARRSRCSPV